jgi:exodeoxyribonuclease III
MSIKIFSWNVNGIRAVIRKNEIVPFIEKEQPDVLCIQETKGTQAQAALELPEGYSEFWYPAEKAGYSGTAMFTKLTPLQVINGFPQDIIKDYAVTGDTFGDPNKEGRVLVAEFDKFYVATVYTPNAKDDLGRLQLRHKQWDPAFLAYMKQLETKKPVVFCGDLNVAHTEDDLANPKPNRGKKGFTDEERQGFQNFVDAGFVDTLRMFKQGNGFYTWWSHFAKSRERNVGWRIDYFMVSAALKDKVKAADIHANVMGSDHCPISVTLDI